SSLGRLQASGRALAGGVVASVRASCETCYHALALAVRPGCPAPPSHIRQLVPFAAGAIDEGAGLGIAQWLPLAVPPSLQDFCSRRSHSALRRSRTIQVESARIRRPRVRAGDSSLPLYIARRANVAQALLLAASALLPTLAASGPPKRRVETRRGTQKCVRHDSRCKVILALLLSCRIAVELGADGVGEVVVAAAVGVYGPEHGADHAGVAGWLAQLVLGPGGSLARDDVVHRLADDLWRCVSGEETNGNLISRHRWEKLLGIASHVEPVQQEFCHGGVIVHGAGLIDLAIETFKRRRIVTLHIDKGEDVADGVSDRQIGAE